MFLRLMFAAAMALLLAGCTGWWSETRLIPVTSRDPAGLSGVYVFNGERTILEPAAQGLVRAKDLGDEVPEGEVALALLRVEAPKPSPSVEDKPEEGAAAQVSQPDHSYLMEIPVPNDNGKSVYTYAIVRIGFGSDGSAETMKVLSPLCAKATEAFAARKEEQLCIFDDYARLRAAAFDALAWYEDARMSLDTTTWEREAETYEIAPDAP